MSAEPDHTHDKRKVNLGNDPSGAEHKDEDATATAILKRKKKPNSLIVTDATTDDIFQIPTVAVEKGIVRLNKMGRRLLSQSVIRSLETHMLVWDICNRVWTVGLNALRCH